MNFLKLLKPFSQSIFRFMDTIPEIKMICMQLIITKSHMDVERFPIEQDNNGIHFHQVSKMKNPSPSFEALGKEILP